MKYYNIGNDSKNLEELMCSPVQRYRGSKFTQNEKIQKYYAIFNKPQIGTLTTSDPEIQQVE